MEPGERLRQLFQKGQVEIDKNVPIRRYFRSSQELIRMVSFTLSMYYVTKNCVVVEGCLTAPVTMDSIIFFYLEW